MKHTIYKIKNLINNKEYIGKHSTLNINDSYMGSGSILKLAKEKYGIENFRKETLFVFETEEEMNNKEIELVTEEYISREDVYNIKPGGNGGRGKRTKESIDKFKITWSKKPQHEKDLINYKRNNKLKGLKRSPEQIKNMSKAKKGLSWNDIYGQEKASILKIKASERNKGKSFFKGKIHSEESKTKMRNSTIGFKHSEESKAKMRKAKEGYIPTHLIGSKISNEHKLKISESMKKRTPEERKTIAEKLFKRVQLMDNNKNVVAIFDSVKDFKKYCSDNKLPSVKLRESFENNGLPIKNMRNKNMKQYIGWSAIKLD